MCEQKGKCQKPENLKSTPEECTPEQINECHGADSHHPCNSNKKEEK